jgi:hypothetical protein
MRLFFDFEVLQFTLLVKERVSSPGSNIGQTSSSYLTFIGKSSMRSIAAYSDLVELDLQRLPKRLLVPAWHILPVLKPSSLLYLPSMTSIHYLQNMPTISPFDIDGNKGTQTYSFLPL